VFVIIVVGVSRRRRVADEAPVDQPGGNVLGDARSHVSFRWMLRHGAALPCSCYFLTSRLLGEFLSLLVRRMELSNRSCRCIALPAGCRTMHRSDAFLKHAAECEPNANVTRDPESMVTWKGMAERWRRCAETFTSQNSAVRQPMPVRRRQNAAPTWAHQ